MLFRLSQAPPRRQLAASARAPRRLGLAAPLQTLLPAHRLDLVSALTPNSRRDISKAAVRSYRHWNRVGVPPPL